MDAEEILPTYEREAGHWNQTRRFAAWEAPVLEAALAGQEGAHVLDLGCGTGRPIAEWFAQRGCDVTGVDGAAAMIAMFRAHLPEATAICADMRGLSLGRRFDVVLGFNSFFHLTADAQRAMFPVFAAHAAPGARLLLTTGPSAGEVWGKVGDSAVYHASLDPEEYRSLLAAHGFDVLWFRPEDPALAGHSVWLAQAQLSRSPASA